MNPDRPCWESCGPARTRPGVPAYRQAELEDHGQYLGGDAGTQRTICRALRSLLPCAPSPTVGRLTRRVVARGMLHDRCTLAE